MNAVVYRLSCAGLCAQQHKHLPNAGKRWGAPVHSCAAKPHSLFLRISQACKRNMKTKIRGSETKATIRLLNVMRTSQSIRAIVVINISNYLKTILRTTRTPTRRPTHYTKKHKSQKYHATRIMSQPPRGRPWTLASVSKQKNIKEKPKTKTI